MMKRILSVMMAVMLVFSMTACSAKKQTAETDATASASKKNGEAESVSTEMEGSSEQNETAENKTVNLELMPLEEALAELGLEEQPKSVAITSLSASRLAYKLGLPIAAIPDTIAKEIEELSTLPTLGTAHTPNYEQIVAVDADLVLFEAMFKDSANDVITEQNIPAYFVNCNLYDNVLHVVEVLGVAFGKEDVVKEIITDYNTRTAEALAMAEGREAPSVMILFGSTQSYMIGSEYTFLGDLAKKLGAVNITGAMGIDDATAKGGFLPLSEENAIAANPDYILCLGHGSEEMQALFEEKFTKNEAWSGVTAIKEGNIVYLDSSLFGTNGGIHAIDSLSALAEILYQ
ncbi:MAG: hypothetical protein E7256_13690 [Lachnospiraceae bacterium]|nr:hypothetical protein [Lachnospiraceae bacterium]